MSPLWRYGTCRCKRPSPKYFFHKQSLAQGTFLCRISQFPRIRKCRNYIKGILLFASGRKIGASMTVEAAVALPLFLVFFLNLGCAVELIRLHGNLELALFDVGNRMSVYGYVLSEAKEDAVQEDAERESWLAEIEDIAFTCTYVKKELVSYVGKNYLEHSPIAGGADGLQFWESEIFTGNDTFEVIATYQAAPFSQIAGFRPFRMANRYYGHLWNGYRIPGTEMANEDVDVVYIAENGTVYHEDRNCSHLLLAIQEVTLQEAYAGRNANHERYVLCELCGDGCTGGKVYITEDGKGIHSIQSCAGLKRTVHSVKREDAKGYKPCERCGEE